MKTYFPKKNDIKKDWFVVDVEGKVLGRVASEIAKILRGKHKPQYTPFLDTGDFVIVVNAEKVKVTGNKEKNKIYYSHSGYPGGLKEARLEELRAKKPEEIIRRAVWGMLPKNSLGRKMLKKLKVYRGSQHPHNAQKPKKLEL